MRRASTPPRLARFLLNAVLPPTVAGRSALGDLLEAHDRRPAGLRRDVWFVLTVCDVGLRYLPQRLARAVDGVFRDLRYMLRLGRRRPAPTVAALLTLALAIGGSTAVFTIANNLWLRIELGHDASIALIARYHETGAWLYWPTSEFVQLQRLVPPNGVEGIAISDESVRSSPLPQPAEDTAVVGFVSGSYFSMLRTAVATGRLIKDDDNRRGAPPVAVLDHLYWRRHFAGDPAVVGRTISIGSSVVTVIGVADRDFIDPTNRRPSIWLPLASLQAVGAPDGKLPRGPWAIMRLAPGQTVASVNALLKERLRELTPAPSSEAPRVTEAVASPVTSARALEMSRQILTGVSLIVGLVLALAGANVSTLQLAGVVSRREEVAIRLSCGATPRRVKRQLATECLFVAFAAGAAGWWVARVLTPIVASGIAALGPSQALDVDPDPRVYLFALVATVAVAIGAALVPMSYSRRVNSIPGRRGSAFLDVTAGRPGRAASILISVQTAASVIVLTLAGLQVRSFERLAAIDPGSDVNQIAHVTVDHSRGFRDAGRMERYWPAALERLRSLPGVERASLADFTPLGVRLGNPDNIIDNATDAAYFQTVGLQIVRGRAYTSDEVARHEKVAVISQRLAAKYWPHDDPLGSNMGRIDSHFLNLQVIGGRAARKLGHSPLGN